MNKIIYIYIYIYIYICIRKPVFDKEQQITNKNMRNTKLKIRMFYFGKIVLAILIAFARARRCSLFTTT